MKKENMKLCDLNWFCLIVFTFINFACNSLEKKSNNTPIWVQSHTGGGGYITGLQQNPIAHDIWYARCDVAGLFISNDGGKSWNPKNNGLDKWYNHSVRSLAIHPIDRNVIFRCSGDLRDNHLFGSIHKSIDGGENWYEVSSEVGFFGNGPSRMFGELIMIDPHDSKRIIVAGDSAGVFTSKDNGESWNYVFGKNSSFSTVAAHPKSEGSYFVASKQGELYFSSDYGESWETFFVNPDWHLTEIVFDPFTDNVLYGSIIQTNVSTANDRESVFGGLVKSSDGGKTFEFISNGLPGDFQYNTVTADPDNPCVIYTAADARPGHSLTSLPIYRSKNCGDSWELLNIPEWTNLIDYPSYIRSKEHVGWAISKIRLDLSDSKRLLFSNWYGVSVSNDLGINWNAHQFSGFETNCLENIEVFDGDVYYTVADHSPMTSKDDGESYHSFPSGGMPSSTAIGYDANSGTVIYGLRNKVKAGIFKLVDESVNSLFMFQNPAYIQSIQADPFNKGQFFVLVDGELTSSGGLYKVDISNNTINKLFFPNIPDVTSIPHNSEFIENELLNIVKGQKKNVVGADKLLALDHFREGVVYIGEWTEGLYISEDSGITWENISKDLPFKKDTSSVLTVIKADPKIEGTAYAGFVREGLWMTTDFGENWEKIYPKEDKGFNVLDIALSSFQGKQIIMIGGEDLYWSRMKPSVVMSEDLGETWSNVFDTSKGALRIKGLAFSHELRRAFVATSGNGAYYFDF